MSDTAEPGPAKSTDAAGPAPVAHPLASGTARATKLRPAELDAEQRALYDAIVQGPRAGRHVVPLVDGAGCLEGPFNAFLLRPSLGQGLQTLGSRLRYSSALTDRQREIAILVVAAHHASEFESYAHEPIAQSLGLTAKQLTGIRSGRFDRLEPDEALVARATVEMLTSKDLEDGTYADLRELMDEPRIFELTVVVGYYTLLALQLRVFRVCASYAPEASGD